jgi:hypothetical protein
MFITVCNSDVGDVKKSWFCILMVEEIVFSHMFNDPEIMYSLFQYWDMIGQFPIDICNWNF